MIMTSMVLSPSILIRSERLQKAAGSRSENLDTS
jgi:hypothetical protein